MAEVCYSRGSGEGRNGYISLSITHPLAAAALGTGTRLPPQAAGALVSRWTCACWGRVSLSCLYPPASGLPRSIERERERERGVRVRVCAWVCGCVRV